MKEGYALSPFLFNLVLEYAIWRGDGERGMTVTRQNGS
jgi:hypothetical protein